MIGVIKAEEHFLQKSILFVNKQIFPENGKVFHNFGLGFIPYCNYNITKSKSLFLPIGMMNVNIMGLSFNIHSISKDIFGYGKTKNFIAGYLDNGWLLREMMNTIPNLECGKFIDSNPILDMGTNNIIFGGVKGTNFGLLITSKQDMSNFFGGVFWLKFSSIVIYNYFSFNSDKKLAKLHFLYAVIKAKRLQRVTSLTCAIFNFHKSLQLHSAWKPIKLFLFLPRKKTNLYFDSFPLIAAGA